jgi:hypothetical protein
MCEEVNNKKRLFEEAVQAYKNHLIYSPPASLILLFYGQILYPPCGKS